MREFLVFFLLICICLTLFTPKLWNLQCLVDYEGDSDEEDDEDTSHMSKKARIE